MNMSKPKTFISRFIELLVKTEVVIPESPHSSIKVKYHQRTLVLSILQEPETRLSFRICKKCFQVVLPSSPIVTSFNCWESRGERQVINKTAIRGSEKPKQGRPLKEIPHTRH